MNTQLTIRNLPDSVNQYLRKKSRLTNKSINQVVIEELQEKVSDINDSLDVSLKWFIGSGIDNATIDALSKEDKIQKNLFKKENVIS